MARTRPIYFSAATLAAVISVLTIGVNPVSAGGYGISRAGTSAYFQGLSYAGSAAGGTLASMFWNSAATAELNGINTESSYSLIIPDAEVHVDSAVVPNIGLGTPILQSAFDTAPSDSGNVGSLALVPASYVNYQVNEQVFVGLGLTSEYGLSTEPENNEYQGSLLGRRAKLFTMNANPTIAYRITPGITIGVGAQIEYGEGTLKFATGFPGGDSSVFNGDDWSFGATAGIMFKPIEGTSIGLGWRSQRTLTLEGRFERNATQLPAPFPPIPEATIDAEADVELPDVVTLSLRQAIASNARLMGTVEWTNWSEFKELRLKAREAGANPAVPGANVGSGDTIAVINADWSDGWFFSLGGEYDYNSLITLRAGIGYEISPVDSPEKVLVTIPDGDRVWLSIGGSYRCSEATTLDFGYTHLFIEDIPFESTSISGVDYTGNIDASSEIVSVGMRTKW
jgi:long-chain fatty acid transport protein